MKPLALSLLALFVAQPCVALLPPSAVEAERFIKQLGSDDYYEREAASKTLRALGVSALPALRTACADKDAEVRKRALRLVEDLAPAKHGLWVVPPPPAMIDNELISRPCRLPGHDLR